MFLVRQTVLIEQNHPSPKCHISACAAWHVGLADALIRLRAICKATASAMIVVVTHTSKARASR